jgi:hypothetical protein
VQNGSNNLVLLTRPWPTTQRIQHLLDHGGGLVGSTIPHKRQQELCGAAPVSRRDKKLVMIALQAPN